MNELIENYKAGVPVKVTVEPKAIFWVALGIIVASAAILAIKKLLS